MRITSGDEARAVILVSHDVEVTLGAGHEKVIRHEASTRREFCNAPNTHDVSSDEYLTRVAEEVQQYFHDCFIDSTWPACPIHHRHPLWLHQGSWICEQLHVCVARLGELRASRNSAGRYVILSDRDQTPSA